MKSNIIKLIAAVSALAFAATAFTACSQKPKSGETVSSDSASDSAKSADTQTDSDGTSDIFTAEKIGSVKIDADRVEVTDGGYIYVKDKKYGVISLDGKKDTGAVYTYAADADGAGEGFVAVYNEAKGDDVNVCGLLDAQGNQVIENKYGFISVLSSRYAKVITAKEETDDKDKTLFYTTKKMISFSADDEDLKYAGVWEIYDMEKKQLVKNASGSLPYTVDTHGQYIEFVNDKEEKVRVDANGEALNSNDVLLNDGTHLIVSGNQYHVYSNENEELFSFNVGDMNIGGNVGSYTKDVKASDYLTASSYKDGESVHFYVDRTGKKVSKEFKGYFSYDFNEFILIDGKIYDLKGENVIKGDFKSLHVDEINKSYYYAKGDSNYVIFDKTGKVLYQNDKFNDKDFYSNEFNVAKNGDASKAFFNFGKQDYQIEGDSAANWMVKTNNGNASYNLVETFTGEPVIKGYARYDFITNNQKGTVTVAAYPVVDNNYEAGNFDIYSIKMK